MTGESPPAAGLWVPGPTPEFFRLHFNTDGAVH